MLDEGCDPLAATQGDPEPSGDDLAARPGLFAPGAGGAASASLGPYELEAVLGQGGAGVVYRARHRERGERVALKVLLAGAGANEKQRARFRREVEATARLRHPGLVKLVEQGEANGVPYLALELVEGGTLRDALPALEPRALASLLSRVARAVAHAHAQGLVHRDLKPENVLIRRADGQPVVTDFGLVRELAGASALTRTGQALGTPYYMAPEQIGAKGHGPRTDVWALGVILYEGLCGRTPFADVEDAISLFQAIAGRDPAPPSDFAPSTPPALERACMRALSKDPLLRHPDAGAFAEDLEAFVEGRVAPPAARTTARSALVAAGGVVILGALAAGAVVAWTLLREVGPTVAAAKASAPAEATPASSLRAGGATPAATPELAPSGDPAINPTEAPRSAPVAHAAIPEPAPPEPAPPEPAPPEPAPPEPAAPEPAPPEPAAPEPGAPEPAAPEPATARQTAPEPAAPEPTAPTDVQVIGAARSLDRGTSGRESLGPVATPPTAPPLDRDAGAAAAQPATAPGPATAPVDPPAPAPGAPTAASAVEPPALLSSDPLDGIGRVPVRLTRLPTSEAEFLALRGAIGGTPRGGAALFVVGLLLLTEDERLGRSCLGAVLSQEHLVGGLPSAQVLGNLRGRLLPKPYVVRSYFEGTTPESGYAMAPGPCTIVIDVRQSDLGARSAQVYVSSTGARSSRPMGLVSGPDGLWRAQRWSSLEVGVTPPGP